MYLLSDGPVTSPDPRSNSRSSLPTKERGVHPKPGEKGLLLARPSGESLTIMSSIVRAQHEDTAHKVRTQRTNRCSLIRGARGTPPVHMVPLSGLGPMVPYPRKGKATRFSNGALFEPVGRALPSIWPWKLPMVIGRSGQ